MIDRQMPVSSSSGEGRTLGVLGKLPVADNPGRDRESRRMQSAGIMVPAGSLARRRRRAEVMDGRDLDPARHVAALVGLSRINFWSGSARIVWPPLRALLSEAAGRVVRVVDVATGAGDVSLRLWRKAQRAGLALEL